MKVLVLVRVRDDRSTRLRMAGTMLADVNKSPIVQFELELA